MDRRLYKVFCVLILLGLVQLLTLESRQIAYSYGFISVKFSVNYMYKLNLRVMSQLPFISNDARNHTCLSYVDMSSCLCVGEISKDF